MLGFDLLRFRGRRLNYLFWEARKYGGGRRNEGELHPALISIDDLAKDGKREDISRCHNYTHSPFPTIFAASIAN